MISNFATKSRSLIRESSKSPGEPSALPSIDRKCFKFHILYVLNFFCLLVKPFQCEADFFKKMCSFSRNPRTGSNQSDGFWRNANGALHVQKRRPCISRRAESIPLVQIEKWTWPGLVTRRFLLGLGSLGQRSVDKRSVPNSAFLSFNLSGLTLRRRIEKYITYLGLIFYSKGKSNSRASFYWNNVLLPV